MEKRIIDKNGACIDIYQPKQAPKAAVVICPGGGYENLCEREAGPVAEQFVAGGYLAVVLWYEVKAPVLKNVPLQPTGRCSMLVKR